MPKINKDAINTLFDYGYNIDLRLITVGSNDGDEISQQSAERLINAIMVMESISHKHAINVNVITPGGSWPAAMAMFDVLKSCRCPIIMRGMGEIKSSGVWLIQAASKGKRYIYPNTELLLHDGQDGFAGHPRDLERYAEASKNARNRSYQLLAAATGHKADFFRKKMTGDWHISAQQAIDLNLADKIITRNLT